MILLLLLLLMLIQRVVHGNFTVVFCQRHHKVTLKTFKLQTIIDHRAHPILYGTFPAPSSDAISAPAPPDAVAEEEASVVDVFEALAACTSACSWRCLNDDSQAPVKGNVTKYLA